jgi:hypothetical protein
MVNSIIGTHLQTLIIDSRQTTTSGEELCINKKVRAKSTTMHCDHDEAQTKDERSGGGSLVKPENE